MTGAILDAQHHLADLDLVAGFHVDRGHASGDGGRHLDRRFVGFELENRLIFGDGVAGFDENAQDVTCGDVLTQFGKSEVSHRYEFAGLLFSGLMLYALIAC